MRRDLPEKCKKLCRKCFAQRCAPGISHKPQKFSPQIVHRVGAKHLRRDLPEKCKKLCRKCFAQRCAPGISHKPQKFSPQIVHGSRAKHLHPHFPQISKIFTANHGWGMGEAFAPAFPANFKDFHGKSWMGHGRSICTRIFCTIPQVFAANASPLQFSPTAPLDRRFL
ncbi:hypothetical protein [Prochlorothrix hollandica]|uniref:hypothetical protein n=1 Tax=Prochlorothrix hollandica TaxID=1223 RepID=UPI0011D1B781|nr:hypothetical protein [Prochlorothrix hollandica]